MSDQIAYEDEDLVLYRDGASAWRINTGGVIQYDPAGRPVWQTDADGDPVEPDIPFPAATYNQTVAQIQAAQEMADAGDAPDGYYDPAEAIRGDLAVINQRIDDMNTRSQHQLLVPHQDSPEQIAASMKYQKDRAAALLGRRLSVREAREGWNRAIDRAEALGQSPDLFEALADAGDEGKPILHNLDHDNPHKATEARQALLGEFWREQADDAPDPLTGQAQPSMPAYDLDNVDERHAYLGDKLAGADVEGLSYRSSDDQEEIY